MIYSILPTEIYVKKIDSYEDTQAEVQKGINECNFDYQKEWGKTVKLSNTEDWTACVIDRFDMQVLKEQIKKSVEEYAGRSLEYVCTSWIAKYDRGDYAQIHSHYPATYSGCYFHSTGEQDSCNFFFDNDYNRCQLDIRPGHLLIFPSYLKHGVTTNESDIPKITLAFNLAVY